MAARMVRSSNGGNSFDDRYLVTVKLAVRAVSKDAALELVQINLDSIRELAGYKLDRIEAL